jgi:AraC-like DNA-binding protein
MNDGRRIRYGRPATNARRRTTPRLRPVSGPGLPVNSEGVPPLAKILDLIARHAVADGANATALPGVALLKQSDATAAPSHSVHQPALCLIVQGAKQVMLNGELYEYDAGGYLIVSVEVPIASRVTKATQANPYLCLRIELDPVQIAALILDAGISSPADCAVSRALAVAQTPADLLDAVVRLARLLDFPQDINTLAPLAMREILYRLLKGEQGARLHQIAATDGRTQRISHAIRWLKKHFDQPLRIEDIAREAHMSTSSLHHHFKAVTAMSPLQYQKQLRLLEARRLMLSQDVDAATAGHRVGYESPSQFGREYARLFGAPPARDLRRLREQIPTPF